MAAEDPTIPLGSDMWTQRALVSGQDRPHCGALVSMARLSNGCQQGTPRCPWVITQWTWPSPAWRVVEEKERKHKGLGNYPMVTESPKRDYLR